MSNPSEKIFCPTPGTVFINYLFTRPEKREERENINETIPTMISRFALLCFLAFSSCVFNDAPLTTTSMITNFGGGINVFVQASEETSEFLSSGAWATVQLAFNDGGVETSCPCPVGCMNCAFQDSSMFGGDNTVKTLYSTSTMPTVAISTGGSATFAGYTNTTGTAERMTLQGCPDVSLMVCFHGNNGQGYYATAYSGAYSQEGIGTVGFIFANLVAFALV